MGLDESLDITTWRLKSNASWSRMTQREKDDEPHRARVHMQFVCRMYKLQHDEGRYFLHEQCQRELPWRKDCVEEIQEMTGAKLMSVRRGNCNLPSNEKPAVMVTNCPDYFHFTTFCEGSPPEQKIL